RRRPSSHSRGVVRDVGHRRGRVAFRGRTYPGAWRPARLGRRRRAAAARLWSCSAGAGRALPGRGGLVGPPTSRRPDGVLPWTAKEGGARRDAASAVAGEKAPNQAGLAALRVAGAGTQKPL